MMGEGFERGSVLLGKYRVESVLGRGGMAVVLKVTHVQLEEELAVKVLLPERATNQDVAARFLREAQAVARLRGEHVARVSDVGVLSDGLPCMVMEYLRGIDLCGEIARRGTLPPGEAVDHVLQACEALAEAHARGIVHRDIKPANLFLTARPDGSPLIKVLDFGISKTPLHTAELATKTEVFMGTPGYMSPEQMRTSKDVDPRTDIWALGIVLYECLSGRRPFQGESFASTVLKAATEPPPPLDPSIPLELQAAVLRCLEKDRRERFGSVAALAAALAPFARNHRDAETIVERTAHMQDGLPRGIEPALHWAPSPATTLSQSAGATAVRPRRRFALTRGASLGSLALLTVMALIVSVQLYPGEPSEMGISRATGQPPTELVVERRGSAAPELIAGSAGQQLKAASDITGKADPAPEAGRGDSGAVSAPPASPGSSACDAIDAIVQEAKGRDGAGDPRSALQLIQDVLRCPQGTSVMRYILAGRYACRARDHQTASEYRKQVPVELRREIEQACLKVGIQLLGS
jgi:serine/threonine-protein kinase